MPEAIEIEGLDEVQELFKKLSDSLNDTTPVMREISNSLYNITMDSFAGQKSPSGTPWKRLADSTLKSKKHQGKILYETGHLQMSMYMYADRDSAELGTNLPYAAIHQFGGDAGRGGSTHISARPYMPITDGGDLYPKAWDEIMDILDEFMGMLD